MTIGLLRRYAGRAFPEVVVTEKRLNTITGFSIATPGAINLYTVPASSECVVTSVVLRCKTATAVTVVAQVGVGANAGADDIYISRALTDFDSVNDQWILADTGGGVIAQAAQIIRLGVDVGATATAQTVDIDIYGYVYGV